jgi:hypothetical protein
MSKSMAGHEKMRRHNIKVMNRGDFFNKTPNMAQCLIAHFQHDEELHDDDECSIFV